MEYVFTAELWIWDARKSDSWVFVTVPPEHSDDVRATAAPSAGFGSIRVEVTLGGSTWRTSIFPDKESGCYVLPIKASVRRSEAVQAGDTVELQLQTI